MNRNIYRIKPCSFLFVIAIVLSAIATERVLYADPVFADHTIVANYAIIPQSYIDAVKTMLVDIPGESHSSGYRIGCQLLEDIDDRFQINIDTDGAPEPYTDQYMRLTNATWGDVDHSTGWIHGYGGDLQTFPYIHDDNMLDLDSTYTEDGDHIGERGALRLAKAMWWMLARIAGWDGNASGIEDDIISRTPAHPSVGVIGVHPNPAVNSSPLIRAIVPCGEDGNGEIAIFDAQGRKIHSVKLGRLAGTLMPGNKMCYEYRWEQHQADGVYFAEVHYDAPGAKTGARQKIVICR